MVGALSSLKRFGQGPSWSPVVTVSQSASFKNALVQDCEIGFTYTRWGRTKCPKNNTELVYSGYVGGSLYSHKGGAVDYLCLPKNPDRNYEYVKGVSGTKGYVYGAEYEINENHIGISRSHHDYDVPCAVCRTVGSTSVLMIPGKTKCEKSWTKQYSGYLMSGYHIHEAASQYICVDKDAENVPGSSVNKNGKLLFPVEAQCGSLKCPPYSTGQELACVVCSK
ncbi:hypothetical protein FSP39_015894 [Pinctada imbricata]|uniref:Short-chain collagen C4-like n=1 Tax=Pinctada imbricata TaxID=66713 RepID=A0AA88Y8L8_PINIB|nr:hypothetical protein FSP39_015894 [Pinctada imbricata]